MQILRRSDRESRGQSLVEFAIVVPVLLLLVLAAIDFGRAFLGWITLQNMARVGANFAAVNPDAWPGSPTEQARYQSLMLASGTDTNCPVATPLPAPVFGPSKNPGDPVRVDLSCQFRILTPVIGNIVGGSVTLAASSTFPITYGSLGAVNPGPGAPPPPPTSNCRTVPNVVGLSVAGAELAWTAAGFTGDVSTSPPGADSTLTVAAVESITSPPDAEACPSGQAFFSSSITVATGTAGTGPDGCVVVPNLTGMTVAMARGSWSGAGFAAESFAPSAAASSPEIEAKIVFLQTTSPGSQPGECVDATTSVQVSYQDAPPPPPPAPCKVPSFINTSSDSAAATWTGAGFSGSLTFDQPNRLPYTIKSQGLVGGTYVSCTSSIEVSWK
jgi:hypothetical protein